MLSGDGAPEKNYPVEISSAALVRRVNVLGGAAALRVFRGVCQVAQRGRYRARTMTMPLRKFCKCARNYSDPCEIDTV